MDNSQLSEQINKKYASLKRHEANVERLLNKEPFTEFDNKKLHREKYMVRKICKAISDIEEHLKNNNMITEDYVNFETAKLLKEKGYCNVSTVFYKENGELIRYNVPLNNNGISDTLGVFYEAPTLQMAMKWLREKHNLHVEVRITNHGMTIDIIKYYWVMTNTETGRWCDESTIYTAKAFDTPEEAEDDAIRHALEKM